MRHSIIDSHQHFWKYDSVRDAWISDEMGVLKRDFLPEELHVIYTRHGIQGCVAVQADQSDNETKFLLSLSKQHDFIRGVVGWIDLKGKRLEEQLEAYSQEKKVKGFRHIVQAEPAGFLLDQAFQRGVKTLNRYGYTYDLLIYHHQLEEAAVFAAITEGTRMVVDHAAKPPIKNKERKGWKESMKKLARFENIFCKISGMVTEADWSHWTADDLNPYLEDVFELFGASRILYGSDWPVCLLAATYEQQLSIVLSFVERLSADEKKRVLYENAVRFYNL